MNAQVPRSDDHQQRALQLYAAFGAALILSLLPFVTAAVFSLCLFLALLIMAYVYRHQAETNSLLENHAIFIIRTIWIGGLYSVITLTIGSAYLLPNVDNEPLMPCVNDIINAAQGGTLMSEAEMIETFTPCFNNFMSFNYNVLMISLLITAGPVLLYFAVRFMRGLTRATKGYRVANPQSWF